MNDHAESDVDRRLNKLEDDVRGLRDFQKMLMGAVAGVSTILAFLADAIRKKLGL